MTRLSISAILAVLTITVSGCNSPQPDAGNPNMRVADSAYSITGKINGLDTGWAYLLKLETDSQHDAPDSARIEGGSFSFKGFSARPQFAELGINGLMGNDFPRFFLDRGALSVKGEKDSLGKIIITGSRAEDEYLGFLKSLSPIDLAQSKLDTLYDLARKAKDPELLDSLENGFNALERQRKASVKEYAHSHPSSYVAAFEVVSHYSYDPEPGALDSIYNGLDSTLQNSFFGRKIKAILAIAKLLDIGQPAPDFVQEDARDRPVSPGAFKGKYVLLDFWASWCSPCRGESPNLVKAYRRYHPKGFEILAVSLDDNKKDWLDAIKKDQLSWSQVCDLKGGGGKVPRLYGITGIPMNFLLDPDGRIIAKGLRGEQLEKKLAELLPDGK